MIFFGAMILWRFRPPQNILSRLDSSLKFHLKSSLRDGIPPVNHHSAPTAGNRHRAGGLRPGDGRVWSGAELHVPSPEVGSCILAKLRVGPAAGDLSYNVVGICSISKMQCEAQHSSVIGRTRVWNRFAFRFSPAQAPRRRYAAYLGRP